MGDARRECRKLVGLLPAGSGRQAGREANLIDKPERPSAERRASSASSSLLPLATGIYLLAAVGALVWIVWSGRRVAPELFVDPARWPADLGIGVVAAAAMLAVWVLARRLLPICRRLEREFAGLLGGLTRRQALTLALVSGFSEELLFRGAVQGAWGYPAATVLFGLLHTGRGRPFLVWTASALIAGAVLGALVLWRGDLLAAMVAHTVVNGVQLERLRRHATG